MAEVRFFTSTNQEVCLSSSRTEDQGGWGFGRRLKFEITSGVQKKATALLIEPLDPQTNKVVRLCGSSKSKKEHKAVVFRPQRPDVHSKGVSVGCLSFYCKGKSSNITGCSAKEPSSIKLRFTLSFSKARRPGTKPRGVTRYPSIEGTDKKKRRSWNSSYGPVYGSPIKVELKDKVKSKRSYSRKDEESSESSSHSFSNANQSTTVTLNIKGLSVNAASAIIHAEDTLPCKSRAVTSRSSPIVAKRTNPDSYSLHGLATHEERAGINESTGCDTTISCASSEESGLTSSGYCEDACASEGEGFLDCSSDYESNTSNEGIGNHSDLLPTSKKRKYIESLGDEIVQEHKKSKTKRREYNIQVRKHTESKLVKSEPSAKVGRKTWNSLSASQPLRTFVCDHPKNTCLPQDVETPEPALSLAPLTAIIYNGDIPEPNSPPEPNTLRDTMNHSDKSIESQVPTEILKFTLEGTYDTAPEAKIPGKGLEPPTAVNDTPSSSFASFSEGHNSMELWQKSQHVAACTPEALKKRYQRLTATVLPKEYNLLYYLNTSRSPSAPVPHLYTKSGSLFPASYPTHSSFPFDDFAWHSVSRPEEIDEEFWNTEEWM